MKEILSHAGKTPKDILLPPVDEYEIEVAKKEQAESWTLTRTLTGSTLFEELTGTKGEKGITSG